MLLPRSARSPANVSTKPTRATRPGTVRRMPSGDAKASPSRLATGIGGAGDTGDTVEGVRVGASPTRDRFIAPPIPSGPCKAAEQPPPASPRLLDPEFDAAAEVRTAVGEHLVLFEDRQHDRQAQRLR